MHMSTQHRLEELAIELEKAEAHHGNWSGAPYPWTDTKAATAFRRAARIIRQALARGD